MTFVCSLIFLNILYFSYRWSIPLTYFDSSSQEVKRMWFNYNDAETVVNLGNVDWFKFNKNQVGYYRVNYPKENWVALTKALTENVNVSFISVFIIVW